MTTTNSKSTNCDLSNQSSKELEETQKHLSDKTINTDQSKSPIAEKSISTTLQLDNDYFEEIKRSKSLDPKLEYMPDETSENLDLFKSKSNDCNKSIEMTNTRSFLSNKVTPAKSISPVLNIETIVPPILNKINDISYDANNEVRHYESLNNSSYSQNKDSFNGANISVEKNEILISSKKLIPKNTYIDKPLIPNTAMILSNCKERMLTAPIVNHDEDKMSSDSDHSTILITRTSTALKRETKKNLLSDITRLKLYLPKKFVMQLEQNWFFSIRKDCKVTIELSSYKHDTKSVAVTIVGLVKNISEACGKISEAKLRILHKNTQDFNDYTCRIYMVESKKTCNALKRKQQQFLEFISKKYQCYITIGSDENPRGDEDIIGLSGNSISIKKVVYEILKKIEFGTLKSNHESEIKLENKSKTSNNKRKKSTSRPSSKKLDTVRNVNKKETSIINLSNLENDATNISAELDSLPLKTLKIPQDKFMSSIKSTLFSKSLLFLNEPAIKDELLGYSHINVIFYKICEENISVEVYAGFDSVYKPYFGKNILKNYEVHYDVYIDFCSYSNTKQQKFTLIASVPNAFRALDKMNDRISSRIKNP